VWVVGVRIDGLIFLTHSGMFPCFFGGI
jgi:hypothetical protein